MLCSPPFYVLLLHFLINAGNGNRICHLNGAWCHSKLSGRDFMASNENGRKKERKKKFSNRSSSLDANTNRKRFTRFARSHLQQFCGFRRWWGWWRKVIAEANARDTLAEENCTKRRPLRTRKHNFPSYIHDKASLFASKRFGELLLRATRVTESLWIKLDAKQMLSMANYGDIHYDELVNTRLT